MNINTSTLLNMLAPKLTTATKTTIENLSKDGKVAVTTLLKDSNIKTLLNSLVQDLTIGAKTKETVSQLLQNSKPIFDLKNLSNDIKDILKHIQADPKLEKQTAVLKQFQVDIKNIDEKVLKEKVFNSGVFLESKLAIVKNSLANNANLEQKIPPQTTASKVQGDIKAVLLQVQEQLNTKATEVPKEIKAQVEKVLSQIEFYQVSSYTSNSNHMYLPVNWDNMEDANIKFSSTKKENYSCHIGLTLKDYGDIKAMLLLDNNNNLNINISAMDKDFKNRLQENMQTLRQGINKIGLSLQSLNVFDMQDVKTQTYEQKAYSSSEKLNFGIDLKA